MANENEDPKKIKLEYKANEPNGMYFIDNNSPYGFVLNNSGGQPVDANQFATKGYVDNQIAAKGWPEIDFYNIDTLPSTDTPAKWGLKKDTNDIIVGTNMGIKYLTENEAKNYGFTDRSLVPTEGKPTAEDGYIINMVDKDEFSQGIPKIVQKYITVSGKEYVRHSKNDGTFSGWYAITGEGGGSGSVTNEVSPDKSEAVSSSGVWNYLNNPTTGINLLNLRLLEDIPDTTDNNAKLVSYWITKNTIGYCFLSNEDLQFLDVPITGNSDKGILLNMPVFFAGVGNSYTSQLVFVNDNIYYRYGIITRNVISGTWHGDTSNNGRWKKITRPFILSVEEGGTGAVSGQEAFSNIIRDTNQYLTDETGMETDNVLNCIAGNYLFNPHDYYSPSIINLPPIASDYDGNISLIITGEGDNKVYRCFILSGDHTGEYYIGKYDSEYDFDNNKYIIWNKMISYNSTTESSVDIDKPTNITGATSITGDLSVSGNITGDITFNTTRKIDGVNFDGSADVNHFCIAEVDSVDQNHKVINFTVNVPNGFNISGGSLLYIKFNTTNFSSRYSDYIIDFKINNNNYGVYMFTSNNNDNFSIRTVLSVSYIIPGNIYCFIVGNDNKFYFINTPNYMYGSILLDTISKWASMTIGNYTIKYTASSSIQDDPFKDGKNRVVHALIYSTSYKDSIMSVDKNIVLYVISGDDAGIMYFGKVGYNNSNESTDRTVEWHKIMTYDDSEVIKNKGDHSLWTDNFNNVMANAKQDQTITNYDDIYLGTKSELTFKDIPVNSDTPVDWVQLGTCSYTFGGAGGDVAYQANHDFCYKDKYGYIYYVSNTNTSYTITKSTLKNLNPNTISTTKTASYLNKVYKITDTDSESITDIYDETIDTGDYVVYKELKRVKDNNYSDIFYVYGWIKVTNKPISRGDRIEKILNLKNNTCVLMSYPAGSTIYQILYDRGTSNSTILNGGKYMYVRRGWIYYEKNDRDPGTYSISNTWETIGWIEVKVVKDRMYLELLNTKKGVVPSNTTYSNLIFSDDNLSNGFRENKSMYGLLQTGINNNSSSHRTHVLLEAFAPTNVEGSDNTKNADTVVDDFNNIIKNYYSNNRILFYINKGNNKTLDNNNTYTTLGGGATIMGSTAWTETSSINREDVYKMGYYYNDKFYENSDHTTEITGENNKLYADLSNHNVYKYSNNLYERVSTNYPTTEHPKYKSIMSGEPSEGYYSHLITDKHNLIVNSSILSRMAQPGYSNISNFNDITCGLTNFYASSVDDYINRIGIRTHSSVSGLFVYGPSYVTDNGNNFVTQNKQYVTGTKWDFYIYNNNYYPRTEGFWLIKHTQANRDRLNTGQSNDSRIDINYNNDGTSLIPVNIFGSLITVRYTVNDNEILNKSGVRNVRIGTGNVPTLSLGEIYLQYQA